MFSRVPISAGTFPWQSAPDLPGHIAASLCPPFLNTPNGSEIGCTAEAVRKI
ncbi:MAG: hypothetical protein Ct9H300mP11_26120 [Chloroflexota bacterium]|nr:MAG: hypothetical protein Ct9H300mP11_26120 [Chloroflexota bacterium]